MGARDLDFEQTDDEPELSEEELDRFLDELLGDLPSGRPVVPVTYTRQVSPRVVSRRRKTGRSG